MFGYNLTIDIYLYLFLECSLETYIYPSIRPPIYRIWYYLEVKLADLIGCNIISTRSTK